MPLYNVEMTLICTMVVQAENEEQARGVGHQYWKDEVLDNDHVPEMIVTGEVTDGIHLTDGWSGDCLPYGGEQSIAEIMKINDRPAGD